MKTKLITNLKKNVLLVDGLPEDTSEIKDTLANGVYYKLPDGNYDSIYIPDEIKGNWKLLGKLKDLTEQQLKQLVYWDVNPQFKEERLNFKYDFKFELYANYGKGKTYFDAAKESFLSALEAEGLHLNGNPIPKEVGFAGNVSEIEVEFILQKQKIKWQEAEQNVFSQETLIFVEQ